ncbi:LacI family DNA-binding transcriptional regulator [Cellulosimicrobium cellulans]|uniref:LacI family DNA-binding transcriptional regulator n=1 Tax=Cellulosimicrobium cellulans TaxID=1710 RepID=UPI0019628B7E|nr:LacI family DNA-binding transcriptional regulator [Cellulosimicrobium cellulans]
MTLTRVAQRAGVSASTASRYLRGQLNVQPETAARIDAAVREVGYVVPAPGPAPREDERRTGVVALVVPDFVNPFFTALAEEVARLAGDRRVPLVVALSTRHGDAESGLGQLLASDGSLGGVVYVGMSRTDDRLARAVADGLPVVVIDEEVDLDLPVETITVDNYGGAYQATSYLVQQGHRRIAHVAGPAELSTTQDRLRGYVDAMHDAGLDVDPDLVRHGPYTEQFGASTFPYLTRPGNAPTAVFVGSDIVAVGMLGAAELHGISIPDDLSVVGCDGIRVGQWLRPKLTTLEQPVAALALAAMDAIERSMTGDRRAGAPARTVLPLHLVVRGSVARVATA